MMVRKLVTNVNPSIHITKESNSLKNKYTPQVFIKKFVEIRQNQYFNKFELSSGISTGLCLE